MTDALPPAIVGDASFDGQEYGWKISSFPTALAAAERLGFACLGGQLQFRFDGSIFEMYWLNADASDRLPEESWLDFVHRSCKEVAEAFQGLIDKLDIQKVVREWPVLDAMVASAFDPSHALVFVAYFVRQQEFAALRKPRPKPE